MASGSLIITLEPLESLEFLSVLRSFLDILCSCRGPKARVKILVTSGGMSTVTSSSSRLLHNLPLANPLCVMVSQIMKSQIATYGDYGLYCGVLSCSMMEKILSQDRVSSNSASELVQHLSSSLTSLLHEKYLKLSFNFESLKELLSVIEPVLCSKPACGLSATELKALSINTAKVFLKTLDEDLGEVVVLDGGACEGQSRVFQGVLYPVGPEDCIDNLLSQKSHKNGNIHLLLFNIMLTEYKEKECRRDESTVLVDNSVKLDVVASALHILEQAVELQVGIVACQKVVHHTIRMFLQRKNILLLERMGTELTRAVEKLSGAKPVSSVQRLSSSCLQSCLGHVDSVKIVKQSKKQFILLERDNNVATLLLCGPSEEASSELKVVTAQALQALRQLVVVPFVTPGAGCSEACLTVLLQLQTLNAQDHLPFRLEQLRFAVGCLQRTLLGTAGFRQTAISSLSVDSVYYHLWQQKSCCCCGLITANQVEDDHGQWIELNLFSGSDLLLPASHGLVGVPKIPMGIQDGAVLDVYCSKYNALRLALESCSHMLNIGLIVYKHYD